MTGGGGTGGEKKEQAQSLMCLHLMFFLDLSFSRGMHDM